MTPLIKVGRNLTASCNYFHANAVSFADYIVNWLEATLLKQCVETRTAEIMIVLKLAPIWINFGSVEQTPEPASQLPAAHHP